MTEESKPASLSEITNALANGERMYRAFADGKALADSLSSLARNETELRASIAKLREECAAATEERDAAVGQARNARDHAKGDEVQIKIANDNFLAGEQKRRDDIRADIDAANTELATVTAELADARRAIAKITGSVQA